MPGNIFVSLVQTTAELAIQTAVPQRQTTLNCDASILTQVHGCKTDFNDRSDSMAGQIVPKPSRHRFVEQQPHRRTGAGERGLDHNFGQRRLVRTADPTIRPRSALIITPTTGARGLRSQAILAWICQGWKP